MLQFESVHAAEDEDERVLEVAGGKIEVVEVTVT